MIQLCNGLAGMITKDLTKTVCTYKLILGSYYLRLILTYVELYTLIH